MDKKKNFESYAKSLFGKAFGKKPSKNPLKNNVDDDDDDDVPPFSLTSSNTPLFTISNRRHFKNPSRASSSNSNLDLMFDSTELNDLEDENVIDIFGEDQSSPDFSLHQPEDVLVDDKNKMKTPDLDTNSNLPDDGKRKHDKKHKLSDKNKVKPDKSKTDKKDKNDNIENTENSDKKKSKTDKDKRSKSSRDKNGNIEKNEAETEFIIELPPPETPTTKDNCDTIEILEVSDKKKPRKDKDRKSKTKSSHDITSKHGNGSKGDIKNKGNVKTDDKFDFTKGRRSSNISRLEKQNSERDDSGISLNEGDDIFCFLGDEMLSTNQSTMDQMFESHTRSDSGCDLSYFCVDHMKMCSSRAELHKHRNCQLNRRPPSGSSTGRSTPQSNPRTIRVASSRAKRRESNAEAEGVGSRTSNSAHLGMVSMNQEILEKIYNYAGVMVEDREKSKAELQWRKEAMEEWILDYVQEIVAIILKLRERVLPELEDLHKNKTEEASHAITELHKLRAESRNVFQQLQLPADFSDFEKYRSIINESSHQTHEIVDQLKESYDAAENITYEFKLAPEIERLKETETIASVAVITGIPSLPPFLTVPGEADENEEESCFTSMKHLTSTVNIDGNDVAKNTKYCFTGCAYILSEEFIIADWAGGVIRMISKFGLVSDTLKFDQSPWDVVQTCSGQVAVTVPRMRTVYFVEAEPHLKVSKSFSTGCQCFGICKIGDKFAMTCDPWSKGPSIRIFDNVGNTLSIIDKDSIGENLFKCPLHISSDFFGTLFFVSDSAADCVYALSLTGEILFCYEHNELDYPSGITTDRNNYLYICGRKSANVHKISNQGELIERFIQRRHGVRSPCAIAFHPNGDHMILSDLVGEVSTGFWKARLF